MIESYRFDFRGVCHRPCVYWSGLVHRNRHQPRASTTLDFTALSHLRTAGLTILVEDICSSLAAATELFRRITSSNLKTGTFGCGLDPDTFEALRGQWKEFDRVLAGINCIQSVTPNFVPFNKVSTTVSSESVLRPLLPCLDERGILIVRDTLPLDEDMDY